MTSVEQRAGVVEVWMPAEDREGTAASVGRWLKRPGEAVEEHEPLLEINTDKVTVEVPAPAAGFVAEVLKNEGDEVLPGELLGRIRTGGSVAEAEIPRSFPIAPLRVRMTAGEEIAGSDIEREAEGMSPGVRRLLREHGLSAGEVPKVSRGARLAIADVERFVAARGTRSSGSVRQGRLVPHTPMRRAIAAHMTRSVQAAPYVTSVFEADVSAVLRDREERKQAGRVAPSITAYLMHAAMVAMRDVPEVNSRWHDGHLEIFDWVNFGVGTALDTGGLVVPVIREAQAMTLDQLSDALRGMTEKARAGKLTAAEMEGGTFTLSNHGVSGSLLAAPIILPHGQAAILGAGKLQKRVIVCETGGRELFRVRPMMYVTLTVDHRVLDGQQTNGFLGKFVGEVERSKQ